MAFGHLARCFLMDGKLPPYLCVCAILNSSLGPGHTCKKEILLTSDIWYFYFYR